MILEYEYENGLRSKSEKEVEEYVRRLSQQIPCVTSYEKGKQV